jgi:hypothetical protein
MTKRHPIQVRHYEFNDSFKVVKTIHRVLRAESIGNFNPIFCTYNKNKRHLVESDEGDLSDPFRREENYLKTLYICV